MKRINYKAFRELLDQWWGDYDPSKTNRQLRKDIEQFCDGFALRYNGLYPLKHDTSACKAGFDYHAADYNHTLPPNPFCE